MLNLTQHPAVSMGSRMFVGAHRNLRSVHWSRAAADVRSAITWADENGVTEGVATVLNLAHGLEALHDCRVRLKAIDDAERANATWAPPSEGDTLDELRQLRQRVASIDTALRRFLLAVRAHERALTAGILDLNSATAAAAMRDQALVELQWLLDDAGEQPPTNTPATETSP